MQTDQLVETIEFTPAYYILYLKTPVFHHGKTADIVMGLYGRVFADALPLPLCRLLSSAAADPLSSAD